MKKAYLDLPYGQMHYRHAGSGKPVILLHMSGSSSDEYERVGNILSSEYSVYALDFMGFGGSDRPDHYFSFEEHAQSVKDFADAMGISSAYFCGNLVGANITVHIAADYPHLVEKAVLFHCCYNSDPHYWASFRDSAFSKIEVSGDGAHLLEHWKRSHKYGDAPEISNERCICLHKANDWGEALHWALCDDTDLASYLPRANTKAKMFAYPVMENKTPAEAAALMQDCRFELLSDATPYIARSMPERYAGLLRDFFSE